MVRIVIEAPDEFKEMVAAVETLAATVQRIAGRATGGKALDYAAIEREIGAATAGVERTAHQGILRGLDRDVPRIRISGEPYSRVGRYEQTYYTMAGPVELERSVFRRDGERNAKVVDPVGLQAGVVDGAWLPQTALAMAHHVQQARRAISAGAVYCWGVGKDGQLGDGVSSEERRGPVRVADVADAVSFAADVSSACALDRRGRVHCWGGLFAIEIVQPTRAPLASVA